MRVEAASNVLIAVLQDQGSDSIAPAGRKYKRTLATGREAESGPTPVSTPPEVGIGFSCCGHSRHVRMSPEAGTSDLTIETSALGGGTALVSFVKPVSRRGEIGRAHV